VGPDPINPLELENFAYLEFAVGGFFVIIAIFDYFTFIFHPFEAGIVIDLEEKRE
jgi:hypothetical protein